MRRASAHDGERAQERCAQRLGSLDLDSTRRILARKSLGEQSPRSIRIRPHPAGDLDRRAGIESPSGPTRVTLVNAEGNLAMLSGTSMASPHAAGVAALVLSTNRNLAPDQVRMILRQSANDLGTPGWDPLFGHGRVNARRAMEQTP